MNGGSGPTPGAKEAGRLGNAENTKLFNEANPVLKQVLATVAAILGGGSPLTGFGVPLAQQAAGQARGAASTALQGSEKFLAQSGIENSPFAAALQAMIGQQGEEQVAAAPTGVAESLLSMFGQTPLGTLSTGGTLLNVAGGQSQSSQGLLPGLSSLAGGIGGLASGAGGLNWAALAPYLPFFGGGAL